MQSSHSPRLQSSVQRMTFLLHETHVTALTICCTPTILPVMDAVSVPGASTSANSCLKDGISSNGASSSLAEQDISCVFLLLWGLFKICIIFREFLDMVHLFILVRDLLFGICCFQKIFPFSNIFHHSLVDHPMHCLLLCALIYMSAVGVYNEKILAMVVLG